MNEYIKPFHVTAFQVARAYHEEFVCPLRCRSNVNREDCERLQRLVPKMAAILERAVAQPLVSFPFSTSQSNEDFGTGQAIPPVAGQVSLDDVPGVW